MRRLESQLMTVYGYGLAAAFLAVIPLSRLGPEWGALRNWQTVLNLGAALGLGLCAWKGRPAKEPSRGAVLAVAVASAVSMLTNQLFKFYAFEASGSDFPIFDRMLFETTHGRFMFAPTLGLNHFAIHPTWVLVPLSGVHGVFETPLLLVVTTFLALWTAAIPLWWLFHERWSLNAAFLAALAYLTNPWLVRVLDGGFRPEVFYPLASFCFLLAWTRGNKLAWALSLLFLLSLKEDAALLTAGFALAVLGFERARWREGLWVLAASVAMLGLNLGVVQPMLLRSLPPGTAAYGRFWSHLGSSPKEIALGILTSPLDVAGQLLRSDWHRFFAGMLFLPLASRALLPMAPTLLMLGASSSGMMRRFEWYYPLPLLAFAFWGLLEAQPREKGRDFKLAALLLFPLLGAGYMRFPLPDLERVRALRSAASRLEAVPWLCAQEQIAPHLPYRARVGPLDQRCLRREGAMALVNLELDPFPATTEELQSRLTDAAARGGAQPLGGGFYLLAP